MRFYQIQKLIEQEQQIDEVRMGSSDFAKFLQTPLAKEMKAGFEAELIFRGGAGDRRDYYDYDPEYEPDYDMNETVYSIEDIIDFYRNGDFADIGRAQAIRIRDEMMEDYLEWRFEQRIEDFESRAQPLISDWIYENEIDEDDALEEYLRNEMELTDEQVKEALEAGKRYAKRITSSKMQKEIREEVPAYDNFLTASNAIDEQVSSRVEQAIEERDVIWDRVEEEFMDDDDGNDYGEEEWLRSRDIRTARDIEGEYDLNWPHMIDVNDSSSQDGEFNKSYAETLADSLEQDLGVTTTVSGGYHSARRDETTWIFEPDSSLEADDSEDMPVEIVSPPMSLPETNEILPKFFKWAEENGAYANESTGFHMSVSLPNHNPEDIDFTKLALFLGDQYVLDSFGRAANTYAASALGKIKGKAKSIDIPEAFKQMKTDLSKMASDSLSKSSGFGKYTSINPKNGYIEFRSAGGSDYFNDMKKIQNTLIRYAYATSIASNDKIERNEYAKKLYKLLSSVEDKNSDIINLFSQYSAGVMQASALKSHLKQLQYDREVIRRKGKFNYDDSSMPPLDWNGKYQIYNTKSPDNLVYEFNVDTDDEALAALAYWRKNIMSPNLDPYNFSVRRNRDASLVSYEITYEQQGREGVMRVRAESDSAARRDFLNRVRTSGGEPATILRVDRV